MRGGNVLDGCIGEGFGNDLKIILKHDVANPLGPDDFDKYPYSSSNDTISKAFLITLPASARNQLRPAVNSR